MAAIFDYGRVTLRQAPTWNPANRYLAWGLAAAVFGFLLTLLLGLVWISALV